MKISKIQAFKCNNGYLWETEEEALRSNIDSIIDESPELKNTSSEDILTFIKENPTEVRYILANIKKINV